MLNTKWHVRALIALSLCYLLAFTACSEKITALDGGEAELKIDLSPANSVDLFSASAFRLTVTGPGISVPLVEMLLFQNGRLTGTVKVPAGPRRTFLIEAFGPSGKLIYSGTTVSDVVAGVTVDLRIDLYPAVPMVKLSPLYLEKPQGAMLYYKIQIYNITNLNEISLELENRGVLSSDYFRPQTVIHNPAIAGFTELSWDMGETELILNIRHLDYNLPFVDESGYAEVATVHYPTYDIGDTPLDTFYFHPTVTALVRNDEIPLPPPEDVYLEDAVAELYYYTTHRIAFWLMNWEGASDSEVLDSSNNNLHGTAYGTVQNEGVYGNARFFWGPTDFIEVPYHPLLDFDRGVTIALYFSTETEDTYFINGTLLSKREENGPINYQLEISNDGTNSYFLFSYGRAPYHSYRVNVLPLANSGWRRLVFSYEFGNPASAVLFFNNESYKGIWISGDGRAQAPLSRSPLLFGKQNSPTPHYFECGLDNVELFDRALDLRTIQQKYGEY